MLDYIPTVVQVIPYEDYTVDIYFDDGKIVCCHAEKDLSPGIFDRIKAYHIFMNKCMVLNGTLARLIRRTHSSFVIELTTYLFF